MPLAPHRWQALVPPAANVGLMVLVNGYDRTTFLADKSLSVHVGTHGNSLGTADATFNNPTVKPVAEDRLTVFVDLIQLFDGVIKDVTLSELRGAFAIVKVGAQDNGPDTLLPTTPPWNLSDTPNGSTTHGYDTAQKVTRTTEGGTPKTTIMTGVREHGLWAGMQVTFKSVTLGEATVAYNIVDASVRFPTRNAPEYDFELGQPLVSLAQLVSSGSMIDPGTITATQISDGSITTPKLNANAVISKLANIAGTVLINEDGVAITGGAMSVNNPGGTVIIDGTSNMFKIVASGTVTITQADSTSGVVDTVLTGLGVWSTIPICFSGVSFSNTLTGNIRQQSREVEFLNMFGAPTSGGATTSKIRGVVAEASVGSYVTGTDAGIRIGLGNWGTSASRTAYGRYQLCKEAGL